MLRLEARFALLRGEADKAVNLWKKFLAGEGAAFDWETYLKAEPETREAALRDHYDFGVALAQAGERQRARDVWQRGSHYPLEPGNHVWHESVNTALQGL